MFNNKHTRSTFYLTFRPYVKLFWKVGLSVLYIDNVFEKYFYFCWSSFYTIYFYFEWRFIRDIYI